MCITVWDLCLTGKPTPNITWYLNGNEIDDQPEETGENIMVSKLAVSELRREHLNTTFKCRAGNTELIPPLEKTILLDIYCKLVKFVTYLLRVPGRVIFMQESVVL